MIHSNEWLYIHLMHIPRGESTTASPARNMYPGSILIYRWILEVWLYLLSWRIQGILRRQLRVVPSMFTALDLSDVACKLIIILSGYLRPRYYWGSQSLFSLIGNEKFLKPCSKIFSYHGEATGNGSLISRRRVLRALCGSTAHSAYNSNERP